MHIWNSTSVTFQRFNIGNESDFNHQISGIDLNTTYSNNYREEMIVEMMWKDILFRVRWFSDVCRLRWIIAGLVLRMLVDFLVLTRWGEKWNEISSRLWSLNIEWAIVVLKKWITIVWEMLTHLLFLLFLTYLKKTKANGRYSNKHTHSSFPKRRKYSLSLVLLRSIVSQWLIIISLMISIHSPRINRSVNWWSNQRIALSKTSFVPHL